MNKLKRLLEAAKNAERTPGIVAGTVPPLHFSKKEERAVAIHLYNNAEAYAELVEAVENYQNNNGVFTDPGIAKALAAIGGE